MRLRALVGFPASGSESDAMLQYVSLSVPYFSKVNHLLLILTLLITIILLLSGLGLLSPDTTRSPTTKRRGEGKINMFLAVQTNNKAGHVDNLLADSDMTLLDQDTSVVDRFGETEFVDTGLQAAFKEIFHLQREHVIEFHAGFVQHADADETANQRVAFEQSFGVFFIEGQELTSSTTDFRQSERNTPHLSLVSQTVFADDFQFGVAEVQIRC